MPVQGWGNAVSGRVNPIVPGVAVLAGLGLYLTGYHWIGAGVAVGSLLGFGNALVLSRRVDLAADIGDVGRALLVMQLGLLLSATTIGVATIILVRISLAMAVASAAGFGGTHLCILAVFYWTRARAGRSALEGKTL
jgi:hypothetical protein